MADEFNYPIYGQTEHQETIVVTPLMIEHLQATKPWVRFLSILTFICAGLMFLVGIFLVVSVSALPGPSVGTSAGIGAGSKTIGPIMGIVYFGIGALYLAPGYFLYQYASHINNLLKGGGDVALESALGSQKSFWRFSGIMALVILCIYVLIFLFAISAAVLSVPRS